MNKEDMIKDIEKQFSLVNDAFREYDELYNAGKLDAARDNFEFISASLAYTLQKFSDMNDTWGLDGMTEMASRYIANYMKYIKISIELVN